MALQLAVVQSCKWATAEDLIKAAGNDREVQSMIAHQYANVNPATVFRQLILCKDALRVAKTAAGNKPCSVQVVRTITRYQDVVGKSTTASAAFVDACLASMKVHKMTIIFLRANKLPKAVEYFGKLHAVAEEMVKVADGVEQNTAQLVVVCSEALEQAQKDVTTTAEEKTKIVKALAFAKSQREKYESEVADLKAHILQAEAEEQALAEKAQEQRDKAFIVQMTGTVFGGITSILKVPAQLASDVVSSHPLSQLTRVAEVAACAAAGHAPAHCAAPAPALDPAAPAPAPAPAAVSLDAAIAANQVEHVRVRKEIMEKKEELQTASADAAPEIEKAIGKLEDILGQVKQDISNASAMAAQHADSLEKQEARQKGHRQNLQQMEREQKAELARTVEEMKHMKLDEGNVEQAYKSLLLCVQTMGKVQATFADVKLFWEQVAMHCKKLAKEASGSGAIQDMLQEMISDPDCKEALEEDFLDLVQTSAKSWAALGLQSNAAWQGMKEARGGVQALMRDLPAGECTKSNLDTMLTEFGDMLALTP